MKKRFLCLFLTLCMVFALAVPAGAVYLDGNNVTGQGLFIVDFDTGVELYSYRGDEYFIPASVTKLMSMYLTFEAIEKGEISMDTVVPVSQNVYKLSRDYSFWNTVPLHYDQTYTVRELMNLIFVYSASASVVALAELIGGDEAGFVARMNAKAQEWGIQASFYGSSGIQDNYVTPRAVAIIARRLLIDYPESLEMAKQVTYNFHGNTYTTTTNHLLTSRPYPGADGLKTGTTNTSGACFVGTAVKDGTRIITVVMKASSGDTRFTDTHKLFDYGFKVRDSVVRELTQRVEPFTDVYKDQWFAGSVEKALERGLMTGTSENTFSPQLDLSRAMAITMLRHSLGDPKPSAGAVFSDVNEEDWFYTAVSWAASEGIDEGAEGRFRPNDSVTRQELAWIMRNCALKYGISPQELPGLDDGSLQPLRSVTRAETAALIIRFDDYMASHK